MYSLLLRLMVLAALVELGLGIRDVAGCRSRECVQKLERASWKVLKIDWKPMSAFPEVATELMRGRL